MAVTHDDVRHVADLARLGVDAVRLDHLVAELNAILGHMDVLSQVDTSDIEMGTATGDASTPLRHDAGVPIALAVPREDFAPSMRDGLFLVPRLASHEDGSDRSP